MRLFAALVPPEDLLADLADFLSPRQEFGPGSMRWTVPEQWHVTLAFMPEVADRHLDELMERLARACGRRGSPLLQAGGGGAFPDPARAKVLYLGVRGVADLDQEYLSRLAVGCRAAAAKAGTEVSGGRFTAHLTLARLSRTVPVPRWIEVLDAFPPRQWRAADVRLIESHLGEGPRRRPRYEELARFPISAPAAGA